MGLFDRLDSVKIPPTVFVVVGVLSTVAVAVLPEKYEVIFGLLALVCYIVVIRLALRHLRGKPW